ncbi:MAG: VOC family protein [Chloroflexi bacterium]|nr:VOC family protein [Chloroflexota bacterium]
MLTGVDHLVVLARDLGAAVAAYERLGFTVTPGGEHPVGTHNALIPFVDGSYVELIAFKEPDRPHEHRWWPFLATSGGLIDFALASDDLEGDLAAATARGLRFAAEEGRRLRPDRQALAWRIGRPSDPDAALPFLIQDVTPRSLRVPEGTARAHRNGAAGVAEVYVAVEDLNAGVLAYAALLGAGAADALPDRRFGVEARALECGAARIVLLPRHAVLDCLPASAQRRGPGVCAAALRAAGRTAAALDPEHAMGALLFLAPR